MLRRVIRRTTRIGGGRVTMVSATIYHAETVAGLTLSRRKKLAFAAAAIALALLVVFLGLLGADLYVHRRFEQSAGVNIWGYRGPIVGRKTPGEVRLVFLGGS